MTEINTHASGDELTEKVDPLHYVWLVDGVPATGTLRQYANALANGHYQGVPVDGLWLFRLAAPGLWFSTHVVVKSTARDEDDWRYIEIETHGEYARYRIDLRA